MDAAEQTVLEQMKSLREKLKNAWEGGPSDEPVVLTTPEAVVAYRLLFGDTRQG